MTQFSRGEPPVNQQRNSVGGLFENAPQQVPDAPWPGPSVILSTLHAQTGQFRRTGLPRVWFGGDYAAIGAAVDGEEPAWYRDVLAHPLVELHDGPVKQVMNAHIAQGAERSAWLQRAAQVWPDYAKLLGGPQQQTLVVVLTPTT